MSTPEMGKRWIETIYLQTAVKVEVKEFSGPYASYFKELLERQKGVKYFIGMPRNLITGQCKDTFGEVMNSGFPGGLLPVDRAIQMMNQACYKG
jgi:multiple sugar transport system substrate-binding protein